MGCTISTAGFAPSENSNGGTIRFQCINCNTSNEGPLQQFRNYEVEVGAGAITSAPTTVNQQFVFNNDERSLASIIAYGRTGYMFCDDGFDLYEGDKIVNSNQYFISCPVLQNDQFDRHLSPDIVESISCRRR